MIEKKSTFIILSYWIPVAQSCTDKHMRTKLYKVLWSNKMWSWKNSDYYFSSLNYLVHLDSLSRAKPQYLIERGETILNKRMK